MGEPRQPRDGAPEVGHMGVGAGFLHPPKTRGRVRRGVGCQALEKTGGVLI